MSVTTIYNSQELDINKSSTMIIIDWDDTLYPTTWVMNSNIELTEPKSRYKYISYFKELDKNISCTLKNILLYGDVIIITNAMPEWIELSSSVLPNTRELLKTIEIVSARKKYQNMHKIIEWKKLTFMDILKKRSIKKNYNNIISLGDAEYEHIALINLYNTNYPFHKYLKSVKFMKTKNYYHVIEQLKVIGHNISYICNRKQHMDLMFDDK
jgi:hypothetical protein